MSLDLVLAKIGLKMKNLVVVDLSFPTMQFPEFKSAYETRYVHLPGKQSSALDFAAGIASQGKVVVLYGSELEDVNLLDKTLNVKLLRRSENRVWDYFEGKLMEFGPAQILIPFDL